MYNLTKNEQKKGKAKPNRDERGTPKKQVESVQIVR